MTRGVLAPRITGVARQEENVKPLLSLTVIAFLTISTIPLAAQETTSMLSPANVGRSTVPGPIATAIASHAARLDAAGTPRSPRSPHLARTWSGVGTGALIGFGAGAVLGMTIGQEACLNEPRWHCAKVGIPFAAVGALVAWLHK